MDLKYSKKYNCINMLKLISLIALLMLYSCGSADKCSDKDITLHMSDDQMTVCSERKVLLHSQYSIRNLNEFIDTLTENSNRSTLNIKLDRDISLCNFYEASRLASFYGYSNQRISVDDANVGLLFKLPDGSVDDEKYNSYRVVDLNSNLKLCFYRLNKSITYTDSSVTINTGSDYETCSKFGTFSEISNQIRLIELDDDYMMQIESDSSWWRASVKNSRELIHMPRLLSIKLYRDMNFNKFIEINSEAFRKINQLNIGLSLDYNLNDICKVTPIEELPNKR